MTDELDHLLAAALAARAEHAPGGSGFTAACGDTATGRLP